MAKVNAVQRTRRWCFTINNPNETHEELVERMTSGYQVRYIVAGAEVAPTTGTNHLQGYVEFENATTFEQMKGRMPSAHLEPAKGSNQQNRDYCTKGDNFCERGTLNTRVQGSEEAKEVCRLVVMDGIHPSRIAVERPEFAPYIVNHFSALISMWREVASAGVAMRADERRAVEVAQ